MADELALKDIVLVLLILISLLSGLLGVYITIIAWREEDMPGKQWRYVFLGGAFGFLAGASASAIMVIDAFGPGRPFDPRVLPMLVCFSLVPALLLAGSVYQSWRYSALHRRYFGTRDKEETGEEE